MKPRNTLTCCRPNAIQDACLQAEIWLAFWQAEDTQVLDTSQLDVIVRQCEVWLQGEVGEIGESQLAECLVKSIHGVTCCHNQLKTKQPALK